MAVKNEPVDAPLPPNARAKAKALAKGVRADQLAEPEQEPPASERSAAVKAMWGYRKASAWSVHRWPLERRVVQERTRVHVPLSLDYSTHTFCTRKTRPALNPWDIRDRSKYRYIFSTSLISTATLNTFYNVHKVMPVANPFLRALLA